MDPVAGIGAVDRDDASPGPSSRPAQVQRARRGSAGRSVTEAINGSIGGQSARARHEHHSSADGFFSANLLSPSKSKHSTPASLVSPSSASRSPRRSSLRAALASYLPIVSWLPAYSVSSDLIGDCLAGLTVGLMVVPQAMAYAQIAELPVLVGLYSALFGCVLYTPLGTAKDLNVGPTSVLSLLVLSSYVGAATQAGAAGLPERLSQASFVCLYAGVLQLLFGFLRLGKILDFISHPVISGFTSASALTIASVQTKNLVGIPVGATFVQNVVAVFSNYSQFLWKDALLGLCCILLLLALSRLKRYQRRTHFLLWLICTGRNALVVFLATLLSLGFMLNGQTPFVTIPPIDSQSHLPTFSLSFLSSPNIEPSFLSLSFSAVAIACIGILEGIAVAKSFAKQNGYSHSLNPSQELIATGATQSIAALFGCYPVGGSFSRTAVNSQAGIRTPLGGLVAGVVLLLSLLFATPLFRFIPQSCLAAVIISAVAFIIDFDIFIRLYRLGEPLAIPHSSLAYSIDFVLVVVAGPVFIPLCLLCRRHRTPAPQAWWDLLTLLVAFWGCLLLSIEWGIAMAVALSIGLAVQRASMPAVRRLYYSNGEWIDKPAADSDSLSTPSSSSSSSSSHAAALEEEEKTSMLAASADDESEWVQRSVLAVRVQGNVMYFSINTILQQLKQYEQQAFVVTSASSSPAASTATTAAVVSEPSSPHRLLRDAAEEEKLRELEEGLESMLMPPSAASTLRYLLIDCIAVNDCDTSGMHGLESLMRDMTARDVSVVFCRLREELQTFLIRAFEEEAMADKDDVAHCFCRSMADGMDSIRRKQAEHPLVTAAE